MRPLLDVQHLTKSIGSRLLFRDLSFTIGDSQHVGLIASNGAGKSTLLSILAGREGRDEGEVTLRSDARISFMEQTPQLKPELTVMEACLADDERAAVVARYEACLAAPGQAGLDAAMEEMDRTGAWDLEHEARRVLTQLRITDMAQPVSQLSGGQARRASLARTLLSAADLYILDEPTNHLDLPMVEWLERELSRTRRAILMVTHDRYFLDRVCSDILELEDEQLYHYHGNYAYYLAKRDERIEAQQAETDRARNLYRRELEWMRRTPSARSSKARYRKEAFERVEAAARQPSQQRQLQLSTESGYIGSKIFEARDVSFSFPTPGGEKCILCGFNYIFSRYEKLGVVGDNGTGKTTFLRLLLGQLKPTGGCFDVGETVRFGYYSQEGMAFDEQMKVIDAARQVAETVSLGDGRSLTTMQFLTHFLFPPSRQQELVYRLSGGERRRLYLCTVLMRQPNFLILDEPTNDLDIATLRLLEEYLAAFKGCVLVVSHDRYFMDRIVDHLLVFEGEGAVRDFPGNYSQYREWQQAQAQAQAAPAAPAKEKKPVPVQPQRPARLSFKEKKEMEALEADIEALEQEKKTLEAAMSSGTMQGEAIAEAAARYARLGDELDEKSMRWLELSERA